METISSIISGAMSEAEARYDDEYKSARLNIVTGEKDLNETTRVTVMKHYSVRPKEYYSERGYDEHCGATYQTYVKTLPPRKFYNVAQIETYVQYINRIAGRTLEVDEMNLLLKTLARGRQYELVCVLDRTEELKGETMWGDKR